MIEVTFTLLFFFGLIIAAVCGVRRSKATERSLAGIRTLVMAVVVVLSLVIGCVLFFVNPVNWQVAVPFWKICVSNGAIVIVVAMTIAVSGRAIWIGRLRTKACHSERSEESTGGLHACGWIVRCAQNDKTSGEGFFDAP